jgi:CheY-like chemotaxis protein
VRAGCPAELPPGNYVVISVTDTGVGMDGETAARCFDPFFTTKPQGQGTGLGLATCYGGARQAGGTITVSSAPGEGSTFRVFLPAAEGEAEQHQPADAPLSGSAEGTETILVVDDEPLLLEIMVETLCSRGYRTLTAANGAEALSRAAHHDGPIHLLLTDVVMPLLGGADLARQLAEARPGLRVLFVSGYTDVAVIEEAARSPNVSFLQKPFSTGQLAARVRELLDGPD